VNCYVVKDLLPNYLDGLVSAETSKDIEEHLSGCDACRKLHEQMKAPIEQPSPRPDKKEINFLKKIKAKTVRTVALGVGTIAVVFGIFAWVFAIGTQANSTEIRAEPRIDKINRVGEVSTQTDGAYLDQEWVIRLELTNGKALRVKTQPVDVEEENGAKHFIITPYSVEPSSFLFESGNFTYGCSYVGEEPPSFDLIVTVRYKDKDVVYSMKEEGLFEPQ